MGKRGRHPPKTGDLLLRMLLSAEEYLETSGDLEEVYYQVCKISGGFRASLWYQWQIVKVTPGVLYNTVYWSVIMFANYLKVAGALPFVLPT